MFKAADLPKTIPAFPLPGALLLPRTRLPLHIFEPRYLAMIEDVLKTPHRLIGMVQPVPGSEGSENLHKIGCAGRVTSFSETDDGRYMVTLTGISRFQISEVTQGFTPYDKCDVTWGSYPRDLGPPEHDAGFKREQFLDLLGRYFAALDLDTKWKALRDAKDEMLINSLCMLCPLSPEDKQALLECQTLQARRTTLTTLLEFALHAGRNDEVMQ